MNPRQMKAMMKRMGMEMEEVEAEEVIIKLRDGEIVIKDPEVTAVVVQGQRSYQITGREVRTGAPEIPEEDIRLVAEQAGVSYEKAKKALEECDGQPAEAILKLMEES